MIYWRSKLPLAAYSRGVHLLVPLLVQILPLLPLLRLVQAIAVVLMGVVVPALLQVVQVWVRLPLKVASRRLLNGCRPLSGAIIATIVTTGTGGSGKY